MKFERKIGEMSTEEDSDGNSSKNGKFLEKAGEILGYALVGLVLGMFFRMIFGLNN